MHRGTPASSGTGGSSGWIPMRTLFSSATGATWRDEVGEVLPDFVGRKPPSVRKRLIKLLVAPRAHLVGAGHVELAPGRAANLGAAAAPDAVAHVRVGGVVDSRLAQVAQVLLVLFDLRRRGRAGSASLRACCARSVLPMFHTVMPASANRFLMARKASAVRMSGVEPTLTYCAPICLRNSSSSSVGFEPVCAQSLMPAAFLRTVAEAGAEAERKAEEVRAPPTASLTNSRRPGVNARLLFLGKSRFGAEFSMAHIPRTAACCCAAATSQYKPGSAPLVLLPDGGRCELFDHGQQQLAVALIQVGRVAANLGQEAQLLV